MADLEDIKRKILNSSPKAFSSDIAKTIEYVSTLEQSSQQHLLGTALVVAEKGFDATTIIAALLHDAELPNDTKQHVSDLVNQVRAIEATTENEDTDEDVITKYILNNTPDLRAVIIKLASVLDKSRHPENISETRKKLYLKQAISIYSEIAEYLDLDSIKKEIDENIFAILQPTEYSAINKKYEEYGINDTLLNKYEEFLEQLLKDINLKIYGRIKSKYSVYDKLKKYEKEWKSPNINSFSDLVAFRCITKDIDDCYIVLEKLMDNGDLDTQQFDDYISNPKPNGYSAMHSVWKFAQISNLPLEIQILTEAMNYTNTYGKASHIAYKASKSRYANPTDKYAWVEEVHKAIEANIRNREEIFNNPVSINLFQEDIFAFTPKGQIIPLSKGDTALDFAYRIHSQIGEKAVSVKINSKAASLGQPLKTGDIVEIKTQKDKNCQTMKALQLANSQSTKSRILKGILKHNKN